MEEKDIASCCLQMRTLLPLIWKRRTLLAVEWKRCTLPAIGWKEEVRVHSKLLEGRFSSFVKLSTPFWPHRRWPKTTARWKHSGNVFSAETAVTSGIVVFEGTRPSHFLAGASPARWENMRQGKFFGHSYSHAESAKFRQSCSSHAPRFTAWLPPPPGGMFPCRSCWLVTSLGLVSVVPGCWGVDRQF
jgi:hypothetical protein